MRQICKIKRRWASLTKVSEENTSGNAADTTVTSKNQSMKMSSFLRDIRKVARRMRQLRDQGFTSEAEAANGW